MPKYTEQIKYSYPIRHNKVLLEIWRCYFHKRKRKSTKNCCLRSY